MNISSHLCSIGAGIPPVGMPLVPPHLTKDSQGYVYWKGHHVEHFSFSRDEAGRQREQRAALALAARCEHLERIGMSISARTVLCEDCLEAPPDSPWKEVLPHYYAFFESESAFVGIFYRSEAGALPSTVFSIEAHDGSVFVTEQVSAFEAFHAYHRAGLRALPVSRSYAQTESNLQRLGVAAERLVQEIQGTRLC